MRSPLTQRVLHIMLSRNDALVQIGSVMTTRATFPLSSAYTAWPRGGAAEPMPAAPDIDVEVAEEEEAEERIDEPWSVVLYNDDVHTFDEVITQLVKATGCSSAEAEKLAWTVHTEGKATVYEGPFEECFEVQGVLREIELVTEIKG